MAASLARDFDLAFTAADRTWAESHPGGSVALILERTGHGLAYSKPVLYPLLAAPFVGLFGDWGAALLNLLVLLCGDRRWRGPFSSGWGAARRRRVTPCSPSSPPASSCRTSPGG